MKIYRGESIGIRLTASDIVLSGWNVGIELATTPNDYKFTASYPSDTTDLVICEEGALKFHIPAHESEKLCEGSLLLHIVISREDIVKLGTFRIGQIISRRTVAGERKAVIDLPLEIVSKELSFTLDLGPNVARNGLSAYDVAVAAGFGGTVEQWITSLRGEAPEISSDTAGNLYSDGEFLNATIPRALERFEERTDAPSEVLAHCDCTLEARVAQLEGLLLDVISGHVVVPKLEVTKLGVWGDNNLARTGRGAPTTAPDKAGQFYIDTSARTLYYATGNTAVADWKNA